MYNIVLGDIIYKQYLIFFSNEKFFVFGKFCYLVLSNMDTGVC